MDEDKVVRDSCLDIFSTKGLRVELAENSEAGIDKVRSLKPDLVIVDIGAPGGEGLQLLEKITGIDPKIVKVALTDSATVEYAVESMRRGAYDFLAKPVSPEKILLTVQRGQEAGRLAAEKEAIEREKRIQSEFFISIISHQLQTPLIAINKYLEVVLGNITGEISGETRELLERSYIRLSELIDSIKDWLVFAQFDPKKARSDFKPIDIVKVLNERVEFLMPFIKERNIEIKLDCPNDHPPVYGSVRVIGEVFANLISNAVKYNRDSGKITITVGYGEENCFISFEDSGIGIPEKDMPSIFDRFYRVKSEETKDIEGTGLGLSITKKFVEAHGGTIEVKSKYGEGSTFTVYLPIFKG
ncbi:MAG: hybrid sensor histidine kinase/response regulator [Deltaproteobacteria bacterium]|uniref:histidine kinase n=1 Tax=Candidatus Zymogenus saltonus TaxID=2844893 RepID=A0A9D8KES1_9DELT|nr:hybrid sensor histidine kinase/response regulator [Candidatus Zymogenus saltonus]